MFVVSILETSVNQSFGSGMNGGSAMRFNVLQEAVDYARVMSEPMTLSGATTYECFCVLYDTETAAKRWWWNGTEYTG